MNRENFIRRMRRRGYEVWWSDEWKMYQDYKSRKYVVAQFHSGSADLYAITRDLLIFNRKRIEELALALEKSPDITTSYCPTLPIQC